MKKLKHIIQESKYLKREFGESLPTFNDVMNKHKLQEGVDLYSHVKAVEQHIADFRKDLDRKLGMWEKKVKKSFDNLIKDFEKAWK
jgi:uncharacterized protein YheU (UPF0270 family)